MSGIQWCSDGLEMAVAAFNKQALGHRSANNWLLLLSIDLAAFYDISSTTGLHLNPFKGLTSSRVFSPPLPWLPTNPQPTTPMSTCGIDEKRSKMVGNLATH